MSNYQDVAKAFDLNHAAKEMLSGSLEQLNACY